MELTAEQKQKIYEEEKARLEIREQLQRENGLMEHSETKKQEGMKECPKCHEEIKKEADVCKHCGAKLGLASKMNEVGNGLIGCGCALILIPLIIVLLVAIF